MVHGVRTFAMKASGPESKPPGPLETPGKTIHAYSSNTGIGGSRKIPEAHWSARLPETELQVH